MLQSLERHVLTLAFDPLFVQHMQQLEAEESRSCVEKILELELGEALQLRFEKLGAAAAAASVVEEDVAERHPQIDLTAFSSDPRVNLLQNLFDAKIRNLFQVRPEAGYHLGMNNAFIREEP